jgi:hypothetical protein
MVSSLLIYIFILTIAGAVRLGRRAGASARNICACVLGGPARVGLRGSIAQHQGEGLRAYDKATE